MILTCRWFITIGFISVGSHILPSGRTTWLVCACCCHRQWLSLGRRCGHLDQQIPGPIPSSSCNACMTCSDCFPDLPKKRRPRIRAVLPLRGTSAQKTFDMTLCDNLIMYIPVMPLALSCNCFIVVSLQLVLVGWVSFLGDSGVFSYGCIYVSGRVHITTRQYPSQTTRTASCASAMQHTLRNYTIYTFHNNNTSYNTMAGQLGHFIGRTHNNLYYITNTSALYPGTRQTA